MSRPRFSAITADLLARKGEARPWNETGKQMLAWDNGHVPMTLHAPEPANEPPPLAHLNPADWKKCAVRMTHRNYERLGILAVKRGTTRHHLLQEAVDSLLTGLPLQFGAGCACLGDKPR